MLAIVLTILKWPGIILLCLLAFVLVLVACILFVPIRYRFHICSKEEDLVTGCVHWLFHILHITLVLKGTQPVFCIRICGIPVKKNQGKDDSDSREQRPKEKSLEIQEETWYPEEEEDTYQAEQEERKDRKSRKTDVEKGPPPEKGPGRQKKTKKKKSPASHFFLSIREKFVTIKDRVLHLVGNIQEVLSGQAEERKTSKVIKIAKDGNTTELVGILWTQVVFLGKHILPTSIKGWVHFGLSDPGLTGRILGAIAVLFAIWGEGFTVIPDFNQAVLEEDLMVKGKIRLIFVVIIAVKVLFSRQWRHFKKQWDG